MPRPTEALGRGAAVRLLPERDGLGIAARKVSTLLVCLVVPVLLLGTFFSVAFVTPAESRINEPAFGWDFRATWRAAGDVLEGRSPYAPPTAAALDGEDQFVYPPGPAFAALPFRLVPFDVAAVLFGLVLVAAVVLTLRALEVCDWRCYGVAFAWVPILESVRLGAVSALLALGVALAWRWRNRLYLAAAPVAALVAAKLFLWPLLVWLAAIGRVRSAVAAVAAALGVTLGAWALIGFKGLRDYPAMLDTLTGLVGPKSYSLAALTDALGLPAPLDRLLPALIGGALLVGVFVYGRRRGVGSDRTALLLAVAAALALTPIVWTHYFALVIVPIALARPRFGPLWLLPLVFWLSPNQSEGELWRIVAVLAVAVGVFAIALGARAPVLFRREVALSSAAKP